MKGMTREKFFLRKNIPIKGERVIENFTFWRLRVRAVIPVQTVISSTHALDG